MVIDYDEFDTLPIDEKIQCVQELWDRISEDDAEDVPLSDAHRAELDRRIEHYRSHPDDVVPWEDVREKLRDSS